MNISFWTSTISKSENLWVSLLSFLTPKFSSCILKNVTILLLFQIRNLAILLEVSPILISIWPANSYPAFVEFWPLYFLVWISTINSVWDSAYILQYSQKCKSIYATLYIGFEIKSETLINPARTTLRLKVRVVLLRPKVDRQEDRFISTELTYRLGISASGRQFIMWYMRADCWPPLGISSVFQFLWESLEVSKTAFSTTIIFL